MMIQECKKEAKEALRGKLFNVSLIAFAFMALTSLDVVFADIFKSSLALRVVYDFFVALLGGGMAIYFLRVYKNKEKDGDLFELFKSNFIDYCLLVFVVQLIIILGIVLFIIPGIIWSYSYRYVIYVKKDNPELNLSEILKKSKDIMDGHKMDSFILDLSFIWMYILGILAFGIGVLPVLAYHGVSKAIFYEKIK